MDKDAPDHQIGFGSKTERDRRYWAALNQILTETPHGPVHLLTHWPAYTRRFDVARFLAHYKVFELAQDVPGWIVELGVARGISYFTWHKLLEIFFPVDTLRKVVGFDSFEGLTDIVDKDSPPAKERFGQWSAADVEDEILALNRLHNADAIIARERGILVKGRVQDSLGQFLESHPSMRISILHLDMDLYEPTLHALELLWDLVLPGGVVAFDELMLPPWAGEIRAWEEFSRARGLNYPIRRFPWAPTPNGYIIK